MANINDPSHADHIPPMKKGDKLNDMRLAMKAVWMMAMGKLSFEVAEDEQQVGDGVSEVLIRRIYTP